MFNEKRKATKVAGVKTSGSKNAFLAKAAVKSAETRSGNGAKKYDTSGNDFIDQFTVAGKYKAPRSFNDIARDADILYAQDKLKAVKFTLFLRTIPRQVNLPDGTKTELAQKGMELKHEAIMRMLWLSTKDKDAFWNNILLFVSLGSWKDIFTMLEYDLSYHGWDSRILNWDEFGDLILTGLNNKNTCELIKKYLPQLKSRSKCKTIEAQSKTEIAKWICSLIFGKKNANSPVSYKQYRKLKTSGTAHDWQKLISQGRFNDIDFSTVHGRALSLLVRGKFLKNQGLSEKYEKWITKPETTNVKYTGFVHELFQPIDNVGWERRNTTITVGQKETINKQFNTLVQKAKDEENYTDLIVVRDTSGSMSSDAPGTKMSCYSIAKALALYFSEFLSGPFAGHWIEFNNVAKLHEWKGSTPVDKWNNDTSNFVGGTNFQSVIDLFVDMKRKGVSESDFPKGILCISDSEFNPSDLGETNVETARKKLKAAGFSKEYCDNFVIVLWNLQNSYYGKGSGEKFETAENTRNVYYFGGYSGSVISFLSNKIKTTYDLLDVALDQEVLNMVKV